MKDNDTNSAVGTPQPGEEESLCGLAVNSLSPLILMPAHGHGDRKRCVRGKQKKKTHHERNGSMATYFRPERFRASTAEGGNELCRQGTKKRFEALLRGFIVFVLAACLLVRRSLKV